MRRSCRRFVIDKKGRKNPPTGAASWLIASFVWNQLLRGELPVLLLHLVMTLKMGLIVVPEIALRNNLKPKYLSIFFPCALDLGKTANGKPYAVSKH